MGGRRRESACARGYWLLCAALAAGACGQTHPASSDGTGTPPTGTGGAGDADGGGDGPSLATRPDPAIPIFDDTQMHHIELTMSPDDWQSIINDTLGDEERHVTVTFDGVVIEDVGVHPSGESSRYAGNPKMSVRLKFDAFPGRGEFGGIKELKLKGQFDDPSMMRDKLAYFVYAGVIPTPHEADARVTVNGELRGLYAIVQMWNGESAKEHFTPPLGALYRIRGWQGEDPYKYIGDAASLYTPLPWEQHLGNPGVGDDVIGTLLASLASSPSTIGDVMDMDYLLGYLAGTTLAMSTDNMVGDSGVQDHFQYFDPVTGKFFALPWDPDNTFSSHDEKPDRSIYIHFSHAVPATIVSNSYKLHLAYKAKINQLIAAVPLAAVQAEADRIYNLIKDTAHEDPVKRFDNGTFDWSWGYIKDFAAQRYANVQDQVANGP
jgi:hypothetical protein